MYGVGDKVVPGLGLFILYQHFPVDWHFQESTTADTMDSLIEPITHEEFEH